MSLPLHSHQPARSHKRERSLGSDPAPPAYHGHSSSTTTDDEDDSLQDESDGSGDDWTEERDRLASRRRGAQAVVASNRRRAGLRAAVAASAGGTSSISLSTDPGTISVGHHRQNRQQQHQQRKAEPLQGLTQTTSRTAAGSSVPVPVGQLTANPSSPSSSSLSSIATTDSSGPSATSEPFLPPHSPASKASAYAHQLPQHQHHQQQQQRQSLSASATISIPQRTLSYSSMPSSSSTSSRPIGLSLAPESLHHHPLSSPVSHGTGARSPQPPSLSPMTISTPTFLTHQQQQFLASAGSKGHSIFTYPSAGPAGVTPPITPVSPYGTSYHPSQQGSYTISGTTSSHPQLQQLQQQYMTNSYSTSASSPSSHSFSPTTQFPPHSAGYVSYFNSSSGRPNSPSQEPQRTRLKRSHSARESTSQLDLDPPSPPIVPENGAFLQIRAHDPYGEPFIGPQTELESAATMAAMAAAKTGAGAGAFVFKVYHMLLDAASQHLIAFTPKGTSFIVTNTTDFSRDVLPKYFKHSNFSSFVRQLNMYSFSKINKTPRGVARGSIDNQEWEFRHPKFVRGKPQQLDEIKRKATDVPSTPTMPDTPDVPSIGMMGAPKMTRSMSGNDALLPTPTIYTGRETRHRVASASGAPGSTSLTTPVLSPGNHLPGPLQAAPAPIVVPAPAGSHAIPHTPSPTASSSSHPLTSHRSSTSAAPPSVLAAQGYPSPQSIHGTPLQFGPPLSSTSTSTQGLPLAARVQLLEQQRDQLEAAIASTQDGYEALYRDLLESRRREDALVQLVEELYTVVQRVHPTQLPYQFPSHVFASKVVDAENPMISVTNADQRHQRGNSVTMYTTPTMANEPTFAEPYYTYDSPTSVEGTQNGLYRTGGHETLYHPQPQRPEVSNLGSAYYPAHESGQHQQLSVDTNVDSGLLNPNAHGAATLVPPPSPGTTFNNAINTPLPASPLPGSSPAPTSGEHGLVGLGLGCSDASTAGQYYDHLHDVDMASSSLANFDGNASKVPHDEDFAEV